MCAAPIELRVLVLANELSERIYRLTDGREYRGDGVLRNQLRRAALSVSSNIAEGDGRRYSKEGIRFFQIAIASAEECKSQLKVAGELGAVPRQEAIRAHEDYSIACRMLNRLIISRKSRGENLE
jgi:four helix bundle protein